ncbi:transcription factor MYB118-like [Gastrolobium bilobum]|uniref:transcription factor MYB118-like n=1 Tax=Gastrolobium bilobum TaxID=150636 RepID=UPI002AB2FAB0|nr:transcription factor MYB118-like [Gastrolobium bilobum]
MEFDPTFQDLFSFFEENPFPNPENNTLLQSNTLNHFEDNNMNVVLDQNPALVMEDPSFIVNPLYEISTPSLGESFEATLQNGSLNNPMNFVPNNQTDALHGHHSDKAMWDLSQTTIQSSIASSSSQPLSPNSDKYGLVLRATLEKELSPFNRDDHCDVEQRHDDDGEKVQQTIINVQNDNNINANIIKGTWTHDEDRVLVELVDRYGMKKWSQIANFLEGRAGKQCRERWLNHLRPNIRKDPWTIEEDMMLIRCHQEVGNKWAEIARRLPGRTENNVKNHWNTTKRRQNTKKGKNKAITYEGSLLLYSYIKSVSGEQLNKSTSNMNMLSNGCNNLAPMFPYGSSNGGFSSQGWATNQVYNQNHAFTGNGGYVPMQVNVDGFATGSVVDGGNVDYGNLGA